MIQVYLIKDAQNNVIWVGETKCALEHRLDAHTRKTGNGSSRARFSQRKDITIEHHSWWPSKKEAYQKQTELQIQYGLQTDCKSISIGLKNSPNRKKGGISSVKSDKHNTKIIHVCPHCNTSMKGVNYFRYHGDRCKNIN